MEAHANATSYDGQAGAAAITLSSSSYENFMSSLYNALKKTGLPSYAVPRLVRITEEYIASRKTKRSTLTPYRIESNATFKKAKQELLKKSWDENEEGSTDKLYWLNGKVYQRLDRSSWDSIKVGSAKL